VSLGRIVLIFDGLEADGGFEAEDGFSWEVLDKCGLRGTFWFEDFFKGGDGWWGFLEGLGCRVGFGYLVYLGIGLSIFMRAVLS
jgi:hypothetical protein